MIKIDKIDGLNDRNVKIIPQFVGIQFSIIMDAIGLLLAVYCPKHIVIPIGKGH